VMDSLPRFDPSPIPWPSGFVLTGPPDFNNLLLIWSKRRRLGSDSAFLVSLLLKTETLRS